MVGWGQNSFPAGPSKAARWEPNLADLTDGHKTHSRSLRAVISERGQLLNLAYRLLGSLADAEDAVQETYARWYAMSQQQQEAIESPGAWLTTVAAASA